jgi:hypothetical protein
MVGELEVPSSMIGPQDREHTTPINFLGLYTVLVVYGLAYAYFYSDQLTPLVHDSLTAFDFSKTRVYTAIAFLTPLAILPIGTRLRSPGQFIAAALTVFLFVPIPIVFAAMVGEPQFWSVYSQLWLGYLAFCTLSALSVKVSLPTVSERKFNAGVLVFCVVIGMAMLYVAATNRFSIVSLADAHAERGSATVAGLQGYLVTGYVTSYGGLIVAVALMYRKYWVLPLALLGFVICYGTLEVRSSILMPAWIAYFYLAQKWFFRNSVTKLVLTLVAPFFVGMLAIDIIGTSERTSLAYLAFSLTNYRLYSVPAIGFNAYFIFFATHPFTHWSHINIIGSFVSNPYGQPLGAVMEDAYRQGSYNASFLETDALAAAGVAALPFISLVFGLILLAINSCMRGLNVALLAVIMAGSAIALIDTGIGPGLLSNGLAILSVLMLFVPRTAAWNLRHLA